MLSRTLVAVAVSAAFVLAGASGATAAVNFDGSPGTSAAPATLGPYSMTAFPSDERANGTAVSTISGPLGDVSLGTDATKHEIGWAGRPGATATAAPLPGLRRQR